MKKTISFVFAAMLCIVLASCGKSAQVETPAVDTVATTVDTTVVNDTVIVITDSLVVK
jgi:uncharacterized lipoprotein YehR (DUF1307 family)